MTDRAKLEEWIRASGLRKAFIAEKMGITAGAFSRKMHGLRQFSPTEIKIFRDLGMSNRETLEIFLS